MNTNKAGESIQNFCKIKRDREESITGHKTLKMWDFMGKKIKKKLSKIVQSSGK